MTSEDCDQFHFTFVFCETCAGEKESKNKFFLICCQLHLLTIHIACDIVKITEGIF